MKRTYIGSTLILLVLLSYSSLLHAQSRPDLWIGLHAGPDFGSSSFDPAPQSGVTLGTKVGIAAGAELDYWLSDHIGLETQVSFVQKGTTEDASFGGILEYTSKLTFSYLQIPLLLRATFGNGDFKPIVFAGPEFGVRLSGSTFLSANGQDTTMDIADSELTALNIGILVGLGVTYQLNPTTIIFLDAAYDHGLTNINAQYGKSGADATTDNQKVYTRDYRISLGVLFGLGK